MFKKKLSQFNFQNIVVYENTIDLLSLKVNTHTEVLLNKVGPSSNKTLYKI